MIIDEFHLNNETLDKTIVVGKKQASVKDHMADALQEKFRDFPEILTNLFWVKPVEASRNRSDNSVDLGQWGQVDIPCIPDSAIRRLRFLASPAGRSREYIVRFVGEPITFFKYTVNGRSAICGNPSTCSIRQKFGIEPVMRHAVNLIDRGDGQLYLAEIPPAVLNPVATWARRRRIDPGGLVAVDFSVTAISVAKNFRYEVMPLDASTLTDEERQMQLYDLKLIFRPTPKSEIETRLFRD